MYAALLALPGADSGAYADEANKAKEAVEDYTLLDAIKQGNR